MYGLISKIGVPSRRSTPRRRISFPETHSNLKARKNIYTYDTYESPSVYLVFNYRAKLNPIGLGLWGDLVEKTPIFFDSFDLGGATLDFLNSPSLRSKTKINQTWENSPMLSKASCIFVPFLRNHSPSSWRMPSASWSIEACRGVPFLDLKSN